MGNRKSKKESAPKEEPVYLVCAPATAPASVRGSSFDNRCSKCGRPVMTAPTGQRFLKQHADAQVLCLYCYEKLPEKGEVELAAPKEEIAAEILDWGPNFWSKRN